MLVSAFMDETQKGFSINLWAASPQSFPNIHCVDFSSKRLVAFAWDQCSLFMSLLVYEHIPVALRLERNVEV